MMAVNSLQLRPEVNPPFIAHAHQIDYSVFHIIDWEGKSRSKYAVDKIWSPCLQPVPNSLWWTKTYFAAYQSCSAEVSMDFHNVTSVYIYITYLSGVIIVVERDLTCVELYLILRVIFKMIEFGWSGQSQVNVSTKCFLPLMIPPVCTKTSAKRCVTLLIKLLTTTGKHLSDGIRVPGSDQQCTQQVRLWGAWSVQVES